MWPFLFGEVKMEVNDQAQAVDESSVEQRMAEYLEAEEANPAEQTELEEDSQEEGTEETEEEDSEDSQEPDEPVYEIKHDGEVKAVKQSELIKLAQEGFDYTAKTQRIADQRKALDERENLLQQSAVILEQLSDKTAELKALDSQLAQYKQVDWHALAQNDPMQYMTHNQTYQQLKEARAEVVGQYQAQASQLTQAQKANRDKLIAQEKKLLLDAVPELRGEKAQQTSQELTSFLLKEGLQQYEIDSMINHRAFTIAYKAMKYDKLMASKPGINKRMADAPKVVKGKAQPSNNANRDLRDRAKRGDEKAILAMIEKSL